LSRSLRQISRAKTLMPPGNRTGSSRVTCRGGGVGHEQGLAQGCGPIIVGWKAVGQKTCTLCCFWCCLWLSISWLVCPLGVVWSPVAWMCHCCHGLGHAGRTLHSQPAT
jgi:hypothetical protein